MPKSRSLNWPFCQLENHHRVDLAGREVHKVQGIRVARDGTEYDVLPTLSLRKEERGEPGALGSMRGVT